MKIQTRTWCLVWATTWGALWAAGCAVDEAPGQGAARGDGFVGGGDRLPDAGADVGDDLGDDPGAGRDAGGLPDGETPDAGGPGDVDGPDASEARCGDGVLDEGELCDGDCPASCDDGDACTVDVLVGSASSCDAVCEARLNEACVGGDGCCPQGCDALGDEDCAPVCGNGVLEPGERCDGDCPQACQAAGACEVAVLEGDAQRCDAVCRVEPVEVCRSDDGCCPSGCAPTEDNDCALDCQVLARWPAQWATLEEQVVEEVNLRRAQGAACGGAELPPVGPLVMDPAMRVASRCHSLDMALNDNFSHTGSDGSSFSQRLRDAGYAGQPRGENIAAGSTTAGSVVDRWMRSEGHCRNIMEQPSNRIGVGFLIHSPSEWTIYWTQTFGTSR